MERNTINSLQSHHLKALPHTSQSMRPFVSLTSLSAAFTWSPIIAFHSIAFLLGYGTSEMDQYYAATCVIGP